MQPTTRVDENTVSVKCIGGCGETFRLPLTGEQEGRWRKGALIQDIAPQIAADDRELLISGTCGECWDKLFAGDDDETWDEIEDVLLSGVRRRPC